MLRRTLLAASLLACGCASEEPPPPPPPPPTQARAEPAPAPQATRAPETVVLSVRQADLATVVLPEFERQAGVKVIWLGDPRPVTLRLTQPIHWSEAMKLVCQFTKTHLTTDYQGRKVLKDGWGGELGDGNVEDLQRNGRGTISASGGRSSGGSSGGGASQPAWNGGGSGGGASASGGSAIPQPTGAYSGGAEAGQILRGVGMNSSNGGGQPR